MQSLAEILLSPNDVFVQSHRIPVNETKVCESIQCRKSNEFCCLISTHIQTSVRSNELNSKEFHLLEGYVFRLMHFALISANFSRRIEIHFVPMSSFFFLSYCSALHISQINSDFIDKRKESESFFLRFFHLIPSNGFPICQTVRYCLSVFAAINVHVCVAHRVQPRFSLSECARDHIAQIDECMRVCDAITHRQHQRVGMSANNVGVERTFHVNHVCIAAFCKIFFFVSFSFFRAWMVDALAVYRLPAAFAV